MGELYQYGVSVMPLGDLVRDFCLEQGNFNQVAFIKNLKHAQKTWLDIFRTTLWQVTTTPVPLCDDNTIRLPDNCERLFNISLVDQFGRLHPLTENTDLNTAQIKYQPIPCSCKKCGGVNTLCGVFDNVTMATEQVVINNSNYTKTIWTRYDGCGQVQQVVSMPTLQAGTSNIVYIETSKAICDVEADANGCIKASQPNVDLLTQALGNTIGVTGFGIGAFMSNISGPVYSELIPPPYNFWGYYNRNAQDPSIVHIFRNNAKITPLVSQVTNPIEIVDQALTGTILVSYQVDGENIGEEILVPKYAYDAMVMGMIYRHKKLSPKDGDRDNKAFFDYRREKNNLFKYLNPVNMELIAKLRTLQRKW